MLDKELSASLTAESSTGGPRPGTIARLRAWLATRDRGALLLVVLFLLVLPLTPRRLYASDEVQYYAYLRSIYFDGDLDFRNEYEHFAALGLSKGDKAVYNALLREHPSDPIVNPKTGKLKNVAPIGSALLWSPGFLLADLGVRAARLLGSDVAADGYSKPYIAGVCLMSALYALGGLLLSYRLARRYTGVFAATVATLLIWLATPLVFYSLILMPWSHAAAFFVFALFLTLWLHDWEQPLEQRVVARGLGRWLLLGLLGGLMTITREQLGLLLLLPAVEGLIGYGRLMRAGRWAQVRRLVAAHALFLGALALALVPQLLAYKALNGQYGPSSTVSGKFHPTSPFFFHTLVDPAHGAFFWSPILPIALLGLLILARRQRLLAAMLALAFLAQTYMNGTFFTWHLTGSFGFRRLIECSPVFIVGLAVLLQTLRQRLPRWPVVLVAAVLVYWNIGLIAQWTFVRPSVLRSGLEWSQMLQYQVVEVPRQVVAKFDVLVNDPCSFAKNGC